MCFFLCKKWRIKAQANDRMTYLEQIDKGKKQFDPVESQCPKANSFCVQRGGVQFIAIILGFAIATIQFYWKVESLRKRNIIKMDKGWKCPDYNCNERP